MKHHDNARVITGIWFLALVIIVILLVGFASAEEDASALTRLQKISDGGFGDPMNNYAWSVAEFGGDLYVGTGRNIPYFVAQAMKAEGAFPENWTLSFLTTPAGSPPPPLVLPNHTLPSQEETVLWSDDMRGEIWKYHEGFWTKVHQASTFVNPANGYTYPEGIGYRAMTTFTDSNGAEAIYAGVGFGFGRTLLLRSTDGTTWEKVNTDSIPSRDTRAITSHNGTLYVGTGDGIFASSSPSATTDTWVKVADFQTASLRSFNGHLYAGTGNPIGPSETNGFEVWRSTTAEPSGPGDWVRVVYGGAGDAWNVLGGTIREYNGDLYVGSMNLPFATGTEGVKGFDVIRVDTGDTWELVVGDEEPKIPTDPRDPPVSGWPSGYANPFNLYAWSFEEYNGNLYLGSYDIFSIARFIDEVPGGYEILMAAITSQDPPEEDGWHQETGAFLMGLMEISNMHEWNMDRSYIISLVKILANNFGGADLWTSPDGEHWVPVDLNGFGDPNNYGFRTMLTTPEGIVVGTANPYTGCQVWVVSSGEMKPPASVSDLHSTTSEKDSITWTWTDPASDDFSHVLVYVDGGFRKIVLKGTETYTATGLDPETAYTLGIKTVGKNGKINQTMVTDTAWTIPASKGWKFRSDLENSGVYDDGGTRPDGTLLWNFTTGNEVESTATVADGVVYFGSYDNNTYALDAGTGNLLWDYPTGDWVESSPAVVNGILYGASCDKNVYALDAATGLHIWNYTMGDYTYSSPAVAHGVVYIGNSDGNIYALDAITGGQLWNYTTGDYVYSSPAVADGVVYIGSFDRNVYALDAITGGLLWNYTTGDSIDCSPAVADGVVYIGSFDRNVYALDAATGALLWNYTTGDAVFSSPAVAHGVVYFGSDDNNLYALDAETGTLIWTYETGGAIHSSPAIANDVVYVGCYDNNLYALDAATGTLLWSSVTGDEIYSSPAIADGVVYIGSRDGNLYAFGSAPKIPPESVSDLHATSSQLDRITWNWTDPATSDFSHVMVYLDGAYQEDVAKGIQSYTATGLTQSRSYTIGTKTVGTTGLINETLVTSTAWTEILPPIADFSAIPRSGDAPLSVSFVDQSSGSLPLSYSWAFGDGSTSTEKNPVHEYLSGGSYTVNLTVTNIEGESSVSRMAYVIVGTVAPLKANFTSNVTSGTVPVSVQFSDTSTGNPGAWSWVFEKDSYYPIRDAGTKEAVPYYGNEFSSEKNPVVTYTDPGNYSVTLTVSRTNETDTITKEDYVRVNPPPPDVDFNAYPHEGNAPLEVEFWESVPYAWYYDEFIWDFGDGTSGTGSWLYHTYENPGLYNVTLTVNSVYGSGSLTKPYYINVTQALPPVPDFEATPVSGDAPLSVMFTDTSAGIITTRFWDFGDGSSSWENVTSSISHTYPFPGTYTVSLIAGNEAGEASITKIGYIQVDPSGTPPDARFSTAPMMGYVPLTVRFSDRSTGSPTAWQWDFGDGNTSSEQNPTHIYATAGRYITRLTAFNSGGSDSFTSYVWVRPTRVFPPYTPHPTPTPSVTTTPTIPPGPATRSPVSFFAMNKTFGSSPMSVQFTDRSFNSPTGWQWDFGDGQTSTLRNPVNTFTVPGTYSVSLTVTNSIGESTTSRRVIVR